ncbi:MAG: hypothetical protein ABI577_05905 [bacterium]
MSDQGNNPEDFLLERLNDAASGDAAVRQLRRRYDSLRSDYEQLLDRLGELEDRVNQPPAPLPAAGANSPVAQSIAEAIAAPLLRLREEYLSALGGIQSVVTGLEGLAVGFKGQHTAPTASVATTEPVPVPQPPAQAPPERTPATEQSRSQKTRVEVKGSGFGELLDFQERLSQIPGVSRVSISAIDNERATLVVELDHPPGSTD